MQKLVIAEPSLTDQRGHHYLLTRLVSEAAIKIGLRVIWLVNRRFSIEITDADVEVRPVFSFTMYDKYRAVSDSSIQPKFTNEIACEITGSLAEMGLSEDDHVLFHTAYFEIFETFFQYFSSEAGNDSPMIHLCTPYDDKTMPGRPNDKAVFDVLKRIACLYAVEKRLFLWAETPQLADYYRSSIGVNVYPLPLPVNNSHEIKEYSGNKDEKTSIKVVYLGAAREEKGFIHLPELVALCRENELTRSRLQFVIQAAPQIVGYNDRIISAIRSLESFDTGFVTLITQSLDEESYRNLLKNADVVLLLYDQVNYRIRGSGIAVEAVSLSKCLVATKNTFCASLIDRGGGAQVSSVLEAYHFLEQYVKFPDLHKIRARHQGYFYTMQNSASYYINRLLYRKVVGTRSWNKPSNVVNFISPLLIQ